MFPGKLAQLPVGKLWAVRSREATMHYHPIDVVEAQLEYQRAEVRRCVAEKRHLGGEVGLPQTDFRSFLRRVRRQVSASSDPVLVKPADR